MDTTEKNVNGTSTASSSVMRRPFYYVAFDTETGIVQGWYTLFERPSAPNFKEVTPQQYEDGHHSAGAKIDEDGNLVPYTPPVVPVPLKEQAAQALQKARTDVYNNYGILGEPTPSEWVAYLRSLMGIASGKDTESTSLPTPPSDTLI